MELFIVVAVLAVVAWVFRDKVKAFIKKARGKVEDKIDDLKD